MIVYVTAYLSEESVASRQNNSEFLILICCLHSVYHRIKQIITAAMFCSMHRTTSNFVKIC